MTKTASECLKDIEIGYRCVSVMFRDNPTIKQHMDTPLIGYGVGYNGVIAILPIYGGYALAYSFGIKHRHSGGSEGGWETIDVEKAVDLIEYNKFLVEKYLDKEAVEKAILKNNGRTRYERPKVGTIEFHYAYRDHNGDLIKSHETFEFEKYKNGRYRISGCFCMYTEKEFLMKYGGKTEVTKNTLPKGIIWEMEKRVAAEAI